MYMKKLVLVIIVMPFFMSCSKPSPYPDSLQAEMKFADFMRLEETSNEVILVYDHNKDGKPDAWIVWTKVPQYTEKVMKIDKNFDGKIDTWQYYGNQDLFAEYDKNFDGKVDEWVYKSGKREFDTDGDGRPDKTNYIPGSTATETVQNPSH